MFGFRIGNFGNSSVSEIRISRGRNTLYFVRPRRGYAGLPYWYIQRGVCCGPVRYLPWLRKVVNVGLGFN